MQQPKFKYPLLTRLLQRTPVWLCGYWPFKKLIVKHFAQPWIDYADTHPLDPEVMTEIGTQLFTLIAEDENQQTHGKTSL